MKLMQCNKKHYYDGDKFTKCPYCTGETGTRMYVDENISETNVTPFVNGRHAQYIPTQIIEKENYTATEIIREESFSSRENISVNKLEKK